jgi:hypothetical protein
MTTTRAGRKNEESHSENVEGGMLVNLQTRRERAKLSLVTNSKRATPNRLGRADTFVKFVTHTLG